MNPLEYSFFFNKKIVSENSEAPIYLLTDLIFNKLNHSSRNIAVRKMALNNIITNVIIGHLNGRYIVTSKSSNDYSNYSWYGLNHYTYRLIVGWIEVLIREGYLNQVLGFYDLESEKGKRTRLCANEKLISTLSEIKNSTENFNSLNYSKKIILKDKDKNLIKYSPSGRLIEKIKFINEYNEFISGNEIYFPFNPETFSSFSLSNSFINLYHLLLSQFTLSQYPVPTGIPLLITLEPNCLFKKRLEGQLYRVFNVSFSKGGRFYAGGSYQQLNETDRAKITINGSPIIEIDYSAFHLNMLYHLTGKQFTEDPYSVVDRPEVRPILKVLCLIVINSENKSQALKALRDEIRKNWEFQKLKRIYRLDEKELLMKFESVHAGISNYFCSGIGLKLMYKDSEIAESVLKHFTKREIPCLCVHDSFLVPVQHKKELEEVMSEVYKKRIGFEPKLK